MFRLVCILIGYFIGCIQSAFVVGKVMHVDLREHGSGNLGSTNALRVLGKRAGAITFACDILKSVASFVLCSMIFKDGGLTAGIYGCAGTVLGHDFPFYLRFKGGKGIAAMIGMVLSLIPISPWMAVYAFGVGIILLIGTRYVSLASMMFAITIPVVAYFIKLPHEAVIVTVALAVLALWRHHANIGRLCQGAEHKLGEKK